MKGGSVTQWKEAAWLSGQNWGFECGKTRVQIPDSDYWMNLSSVILGANSPRFVNSQLVCLLPVGILNWGFLTWHWKAPLGELSLGIHVHVQCRSLGKGMIGAGPPNNYGGKSIDLTLIFNVKVQLNYFLKYWYRTQQLSVVADAGLFQAPLHIGSLTS